MELKRLINRKIQIDGWRRAYKPYMDAYRDKARHKRKPVQRLVGKITKSEFEDYCRLCLYYPGGTPSLEYRELEGRIVEKTLELVDSLTEDQDTRLYFRYLLRRAELPCHEACGPISDNLSPSSFSDELKEISSLISKLIEYRKEDEPREE